MPGQVGVSGLQPTFCGEATEPIILGRNDMAEKAHGLLPLGPPRDSLNLQLPPRPAAERLSREQWVPVRILLLSSYISQC